MGRMKNIREIDLFLPAKYKNIRKSQQFHYFKDWQIQKVHKMRTIRQFDVKSCFM